MSVLTGFYRHFKGGLYEVMGTGSHTETGENLVIYQDCENDETLWIRPLKMFEEWVVHNGVYQPRFSLIHGARKAVKLDAVDGEEGEER